MSLSSANIIHQFIKTAEAYPHQKAIICGKQQIGFSELHHAVRNKAAHLQNKGIGKGDQVLLLVPMSIELYINLLAIFYLGAVAIVIDQVGDRKKTIAYLKQADCKAVIFSGKAWLLWLINPSVRSIPIKIQGRKSPGKSRLDTVVLAADHPALITFTTGSTGTPKAALRTHGFLFRQYQTLKEVTEPCPGKVDFVSLPIVLLINLGVGVVSVIPEKAIDKLKQRDFKSLAKSIAQNKVESLTASPFFLTELVRYHEETGTKLKLKRIFTGGGPVFPDDARKIDRAFEPEIFKIIYGSTEAEPISTIDGSELEKSGVEKGLCVGKVHRQLEVKIIKAHIGQLENFEEVTTGQIGEIIVSGPHVLSDYYNSPEAFHENKIRSGEKLWHRTGDAGFMGIDGKLYLTGRAAQMIYLNDSILSPFLIENQLKSIDGIASGTALMAKENRLVLYIQKTDKSNAREIEAEIQKLQLPVHDLVYIDKMPMDSRHRTKIDYSRLSVMK